MTVSDPSGGGRVRFNPVIDLGSIATAVIMLGAVVSWAIIGYETVNKQLDAQASQLLLVSQRLDSDEKASSSMREDFKSQSTEVRSLLNKLMDQMGDIRSLVAAQGARDGKGR